MTSMPSSDSLWLTDVVHHHLALGVVCIFLGNTVRAFSLNRDQCGLHWYLALSLAALGTASSFAATHIDAFTVYDSRLSQVGGDVSDHMAGKGVRSHRYRLRLQRLVLLVTLRARFISGLLQYRSALLSHLSAITLFLGFHTLGLYVHNDVMQAFGDTGV